MRDKIAAGLLRPINPSLIIVLGLYTVIWGLWISNPLWTVFTQAPVYNFMAALAPEMYWGVQAVVAGAIISYGAIRPSYRNIQLGSFIAFFHWFIIGVMYFMGDWQNTGGITCLCFAVYSAMIWVNIKINRVYFHNLD